MKFPIKFSMNAVLALGLSVLFLLPSNPLGAQALETSISVSNDEFKPIVLDTPVELSNTTKTSDIVWENESRQRVMASNTPLASFTGSTGVTINSHSSDYSSKEKLQLIHEELLKNTVGPELSYLSHIDLYPDYPYGSGVAGRWYGLWKNNKLAVGRSIEIYGVDSLSFDAVAHTLSHEYGHHFTHYYLNLKEGTLSDLSGSGFTKLRALTSYPDYGNDTHEWAPEEIAAEDYTQLFGSSTWKKGLDYQDVRDVALSRDPNLTRQISSLDNYNVQPQENTKLPLAFEVPGLYSYWLDLSKVSVSKDFTPPSQPYLTVSKMEGKTLTLTWTPSTDSVTKDIRYTVVYSNANTSDAPMGIRTTTDSQGREAIIGSYTSGRTIYSDQILSGKTTVWVNAQDEAGNIVRSNSLLLDPNNLAASLSPLPYRISGFDRYGTSIELSKTGWPNGSSVAILVTGNDFPDALSAAPLAKKYNAPILLTGSTLDTKVESELDRLKVQEVILVGGTGVVSESVEAALNLKNIRTKRIEGIDRFSTALAVAQELGTFNQVFIATGENFPDALSAAPIAASQGIPILLTPKNELPEAVGKFLKERSITKTYVLGGSGVVSEKVFSILPNPERLSGLTRYDTNIAILNTFKPSLTLDTTYLATGNNFPDALSGSVLAALTNSPILLTDSGFIAPAQSLIQQNKGNIKNYRIIGGEGALSNSTVAELLK